MKNLDWLFERQRFGIKAGLERVQDLLERLGNPQESFDVILVAGTNGKGSTAATLASILNEVGEPTGLFTSPHLSYFGERFLVAGQPPTPQVLENALARVRPHAEAAEATFFEIVTALAVVIFTEAKVRYAVLECGMGGENDATNVLEPILSLITNVSLDHVGILGNTIADIAQDKAGIMRPQKTCFTAARGEALMGLAAHAQAIKADLNRVKPANVSQKGWQGIELTLGQSTSLTLKSPLVGEFQADNIALAVSAARHLGVPDQAILKGVAATVWPGRLERLEYRNRTLLLDGAHNPAAAAALAKTLKTLPFDTLLLVFGAGRDKDIAAILKILAPLAQHRYLTRATLSPRAASPTELNKLAAGETFDSPQDALNAAVAKASKNDLVLIAGSLYLIGELRPYSLGERAERLERWQ